MGFFDKLFSGLTKTRKNMEDLEELFQGYAPDSEDFYDELEELLVLSDVGAATAERVVYLMRKKTWEDRFRKQGRRPRCGSPRQARSRPRGDGEHEAQGEGGVVSG